LDLVGVHSIDARGLGVLAAVAKWAMRESVELVISNPNQRVHELIRLVNLDKAIRVVCDGSDDVRFPDAEQVSFQKAGATEEPVTEDV
jgi:anti-anti-sigma regulatory factor